MKNLHNSLIFLTFRLSELRRQSFEKHIYFLTFTFTSLSHLSEENLIHFSAEAGRSLTGFVSVPPVSSVSGLWLGPGHSSLVLRRYFSSQADLLFKVIVVFIQMDLSLHPLAKLNPSQLLFGARSTLNGGQLQWKKDLSGMALHASKCHLLHSSTVGHKCK